MVGLLSTHNHFERVDPGEVAGQSFAVVRKGFDQKQVQAFLVSLGDQIRAGQQQIRDLQDQVVQAGQPPEPEAEFSPQGVKLLSGGVEASRKQTEGKVGRVADRARWLSEELEKTVAALQSEHEAAGVGPVAELLEQACQQAKLVDELVEEAREQARAEIGEGRAQGREIVEQAKALRLTVLRDMARRRQAARAQVERLRAGRDKLMATLTEARTSIDQSMEAAKMSLAEAKVMADAAARRVEDEDQPSDSILLSELDDSEMLGIVAAPGPAAGDEAQAGPVLVSPAQNELVEDTPKPIEAGVEAIATPPIEPVTGPVQITESVTLLPLAESDPASSEGPEAAVESPADSDSLTLAEAGEESAAEVDPAQSAVDHPVLSDLDDRHDVDAIFARLRSQDAQV